MMVGSAVLLILRHSAKPYIGFGMGILFFVIAVIQNRVGENLIKAKEVLEEISE